MIREAPPTFHYDRKVINVTGKTVTDIPDRRLIIERMPSLPPKPPSIIIEKWLNEVFYLILKFSIIFNA